MGSSNYFFTSESVTEGHPDKVADAISDSSLIYITPRVNAYNDGIAFLYP